ncbi:response regulator [Pseudenhygromyxa sp. WMMC2535]|uniref:ATP-binding protein n=1 Tax=Pseudenhygromyxa sp. WMMC2535 TaxID=2712867 RepID=UPI00159517BD|nr:ATP-binding protein [Pseudenhygromyxa sp. WMMC2535]NVB41142.1 response regulator [Pseudenhygromyxa sp. WMMC2535]
MSSSGIGSGPLRDASMTRASRSPRILSGGQRKGGSLPLTKGVSEGRLRATLDATTDAIYWLRPCRDAEGKIEDFEFVEVNLAGERELRMPRAQLLGGRLDALLPFNRIGGFSEQYKRVMETGETFEQEYEIPEGFVAPGCYRHRVVRVGDELLIFNRDLSADRAREAEQRRALRLAALGRMAGGIAHDFNNVLAGIGFSAELLEEMITDTDALTIVRGIAASAQRAGRFVKQILMFSRPRESPVEVRALDELCVEILDMLARSLSKRTALHLSLARGLSVAVVPAQLQQVLSNLVTNAAHALSRGQGNIWVTLRRADADELDSLEARREGWAVLEVRDDGMGIPESALEHVFDPFFSTKSPEHGGGLGLAVVHGIVERHGGLVRVRSKLGEGSTFAVWLPLAAPEPRVIRVESRVLAAAGRGLGAGRGVLIVDDDELVAESLAAALDLRGFRVFTAFEGIGARAELSVHGAEIDALVLDLDMPGQSGIELAKDLRAERPELVAVLMTGGGTALSSEELREAGILRVLEKPFPSQRMADTLGALLGAPRERLGTS